MDFLASVPALVKVGLAFVLILILNRVKLHLSWCLFAGAAALGLMMGLPAHKIFLTLGESILETQTLTLALLVALILVMSRLMSDSGHLDRIVSAFTHVTRSVKVVNVVMPALIGLLPMPGGALFSAPMVETASRKANLNPELKTVINYWFRHIWEYWWPLYPGVVLAVSLLGIEAWKFMLFQFPLTLINLGAGTLFLLGLVPSGTPSQPDRKGGWADFRREVRPITLIVLAVPAVSLFKLITGLPLPPLTAVFAGLGLCLALVIRQNHISAAQFSRAVFNKSLPPMILLVLAIMAFKGVLMESRAVTHIQIEMTRYGIPPLLIMLLMPFLSGFITGIAVGFVGASFPLVVPLLAQKSGLDFMSHASLAYAFGYMGIILSPVHLCLLVTKDYFSASLLKSYRYLIGPVLTVLLSVLVLFGLAQWLT